MSGRGYMGVAMKQGFLLKKRFHGSSFGTVFIISYYQNLWAICFWKLEGYSSCTDTHSNKKWPTFTISPPQKVHLLRMHRA